MFARSFLKQIAQLFASNVFTLSPLLLALAATLAIPAIAGATMNPFVRHEFFSNNDKYPGQEIDLTVTKNLIALTDEQIVFYGFARSANEIDRSAYYVANFRHDDRDWIAKIPKHGVRRSIFQFQNLSSLAKEGIPEPILNWMRIGHVQMRFQMAPGHEIELRTQVIGEPKEILKLSDFTYALNAIRAISQRGTPFRALSDGIERGYGTAHIFASIEQSALGFKRAGLNVEQYPLNMTSEESDHMLNFFVMTSVHSRENEIYNTFEHSCVTSTMEGIYTAVPDKHVLWVGRFWRNWRWLRPTQDKFEANPRAVVALLKKQGYIDPARQMPNLEVETHSKAKSCCNVLERKSE